MLRKRPKSPCWWRRRQKVQNAWSLQQMSQANSLWCFLSLMEKHSWAVLDDVCWCSALSTHLAVWPSLSPPRLLCRCQRHSLLPGAVKSLLRILKKLYVYIYLFIYAWYKYTYYLPWSNLDKLPILGDGDQSMNRDSYTYCKDSHYVLDGHTPYTMVWPWFDPRALKHRSESLDNNELQWACQEPKLGESLLHLSGEVYGNFLATKAE